MSITALPVPPTRSDPVNFSARADDFLSALPTFATEANELQADVNAKQIAAANSATNAAASELAANASSNASVWVSGTTYAVGNVRYSPITYLSYRRKTAGAGTTDPSADPTNWELINGTGNVDLTSTQTLTNKEIGTGSTVNGVPVANLVNTTGNQTIGGTKTFSNTIVANINGNAATVSSVTTSQVLSATAGATAGAVGTYVFAKANQDVQFGASIAGSNLQPTSATWAQEIGGGVYTNLAVGSALSGTWIAMGLEDYLQQIPGQQSIYGATLFLRIS